MIQSSDSIKELAPALNAAYGELENVDKDGNNPAFKSRYATLAAIINEVRPILAKHGFAVLQSPGYAEDKKLVIVETLLIHKSGEWMKSVIAVPVTKADAQGVGSAITYARRYSLAAVLGISQEDDDGNEAVSKPKQRKATPATEEKADETRDVAREISECKSVGELTKLAYSLDPDTRAKYADLAKRRMKALQGPEEA